MGLLIAITSAVLLATANMTLKRSFKSFTPAVGFFFFAMISFVIWSVVALSLGVHFEYFLQSLIYGLISAVLAQAFYIYALSKGELSITGTVLATFPIYTILFSFFINGETLNSRQVLFVALTIIGTIIISLPEKISKQDIKNSTYIIWPLAAAISIGVADSLTKKLIDQSSAGTFILGAAIMQVPVAIALLLLLKEKLVGLRELKSNFKEYRLVLLGAMFVSLHTMTLFVAFDFAPASIVSPIIGGLVPVLTVIFSLTILKERVSIKDFVSILIVLAGVIGISLG